MTPSRDPVADTLRSLTLRSRIAWHEANLVRLDFESYRLSH
jgi:hypothetical protein